MGECQEADDVLQVTRDTVVLSLRLAGHEIADAPERIVQAIQSEELSRAIRDTLEAEGRRLAARQLRGETISTEDGQRVLQQLRSAGSSAVEHSVQHQIEASSRYREVERRLQRLERAFQCSPVGIFVDENKTWLYIIASGLALGGVAALYVTRTGDSVASWMTDFSARRLRSIRIGRLEAGTERLRFVPSERVVEVQPFLTVRQWREVRTTFRLNAVFRADAVEAVRGGVDLSVPLARGVSVSASGMVGGTRQVSQGAPTGAMRLVYDLHMGVTIAGPPEFPGLRVHNEFFVRQDEANRSVGGASQVEYDFRHGLSGSLRASGSHRQPLDIAGNEQTEWSVQAGLTWRFQ